MSIKHIFFITISALLYSTSFPLCSIAQEKSNISHSLFSLNPVKSKLSNNNGYKAISLTPPVARPFANAPLPSNSTPYLVHVSETVQPGGVLTLQGSLFPDSTAYLEVVTPSGLSAPIPLTILSTSYNLMQTQVPSTVPYGIWEVYAQEGSAQSNFMYVNRAHAIRQEFDQVTPGGSFGLFGRNLNVSGYTTEVEFRDAVGVNHMATGISGDAYQLYGTAPTDLVPGASYTVYVANGLSGYIQNYPTVDCFSLVHDPITVRAAGVDYFNLGVPWAGDFTSNIYNNVYNVMDYGAKADGVTDDGPAINIVSNLANTNGGGIVYMPTGTYLINTPLRLNSNVVFKGDGPKTTILIYGSTGLWAAHTYLQGCSLCGMMDLTMTNPSSAYEQYSPQQNGTITLANINTTPTILKDFFLNNVNILYSYSNYNAISMGSGYNEVLIRNSTIQSTGAGGAITAAGDTHMTLLSNTFLESNGRFYFDNDDYLLAEGNTFTLDESQLTPSMGAGGPQLSYSAYPVLINNNIQYINTNAQEANENFGEAINAEDAAANTKIFRYAGTVSNASGTTVCDLNANFPASFPVATANEPQFIAILDGTGLGQWRAIVSATPTCLTINKPWDIVPPANSHYTIGMWASQNMMIVGNSFENTWKGAELWVGSWEPLFANNTFNNAVGIELNGGIASPGSGNSYTQPFVQPLWNSYAVNNTLIVSNNNDPLKSRAHIYVTLIQTQPFRYGNSVLGSEVRDNYINCEVTCTGTSVAQQNGQEFGANNYENGYGNFDLWGSNSTQDPTQAGIFGSVFENDTATGITNSIYFYSTDARQTVVDTT